MYKTSTQIADEVLYKLAECSRSDDEKKKRRKSNRSKRPHGDESYGRGRGEGALKDKE